MTNPFAHVTADEKPAGTPVSKTPPEYVCTVPKDNFITVWNPRDEVFSGLFRAG
jgi:hypothetical protein